MSQHNFFPTSSCVTCRRPSPFSPSIRRSRVVMKIPDAASPPRGAGLGKGRPPTRGRALTRSLCHPPPLNIISLFREPLPPLVFFLPWSILGRDHLAWLTCHARPLFGAKFKDGRCLPPPPPKAVRANLVLPLEGSPRSVWLNLAGANNKGAGR